MQSNRLRLATWLLALVGASATASADDSGPMAMVPLQQFLASHGSSMNSLIYVAKRCAGAYLAVSSRMALDETLLTTAKQYKTGADLWAQIALAESQSAGLADTGELESRDIEDIEEIYSSRMRSHYIATGDALDDAIRSDLMLCRADVPPQ